VRILVVEDSLRLQEVIATALRETGHAVDTSADGKTGLWMAQNTDYDVIVLDIMLPGLDGLSVLKALRTGGKSTHVLLLTARDTVVDRVNGLQLGADDYLVKPFALDELLARVHALGRRVYGHKNPRLTVGNLEIDTVAKRVFLAGQDLGLTARDYRLLEFLVHRAGQVVTRSEIEAHIYDDQVEPMSNVVDRAIYLLRTKLDHVSHVPLIHTRRGLGYVLQLPDA